MKKLILFVICFAVGIWMHGILGGLVGLAVAGLLNWFIESGDISLTQPMVASGKQKEGKKEEPIKSGEKTGRIIMIGIFGFGLGVAFFFALFYFPFYLYQAGEGVKQQYIGGPATHWNPGTQAIAPAGKKSDYYHFDGKGDGYNPQGRVKVYFCSNILKQEIFIGEDDPKTLSWKKIKQGYYRFEAVGKSDVIVYLN